MCDCVSWFPMYTTAPSAYSWRSVCCLIVFPDRSYAFFKIGLLCILLFVFRAFYLLCAFQGIFFCFSCSFLSRRRIFLCLFRHCAKLLVGWFRYLSVRDIPTVLLLRLFLGYVCHVVYRIVVCQYAINVYNEEGRTDWGALRNSYIVGYLRSIFPMVFLVLVVCLDVLCVCGVLLLRVSLSCRVRPAVAFGLLPKMLSICP